MFSLKLNLRQLNHALMTTPKGTKCLMIPIVENHLFEGEKGIYLDLVAFDIDKPKENGDTHLIKQSFSKEQREKLGPEFLKALPILGNAKMSSGQRSEPEPKGSDTVAATPENLPF
jgi:hypothetical protein